jgi:hypothetical protein
MSYFVDKLIEEWLKETDCSSLPGAGKPLSLDEYFSWPEDQRVGLSLLYAVSTHYCPVRGQDTMW